MRHLNAFVIFMWTLFFFHVSQISFFLSWSWLKVWCCARKCGSFIFPSFFFWPHEIWDPLTLINALSGEAFETMMNKILKLNTAESFEGSTAITWVELSEQFSALPGNCTLHAHWPFLQEKQLSFHANRVEQPPVLPKRKKEKKMTSLQELG